MAVPAALRSAHPGVTGVPSWGAVLIAVSATLAGFAIEAGSGHRELGFLFAAGFVLGCLGAVLAVRQSAIFTAVIQPPLLLFVAVPLGYFLVHSAPFNGLKDVLITCGYPLIERFPLMLFTSAAVLAIGMARWYLGHAAPAADYAPSAAAPRGWLAGLLTRVTGTDGRPEAPRHVVDRAGGGRARREPRGTRPPERDAPRAAAARPRRERRHREDSFDSPPRRRQPARGARDRSPVEDAGRERRRPRPPRDEQAARRVPRERREPRDPSVPRPRRSTGGDPYDRYSARYERYDRHEGYGPYEPRPPRRDPAAPRRAADPTHHPVSRVRYRGEPTDRGDRSRRER